MLIIHIYTVEYNTVVLLLWSQSCPPVLDYTSRRSTQGLYHIPGSSVERASVTGRTRLVTFNAPCYPIGGTKMRTPILSYTGTFALLTGWRIASLGVPNHQRSISPAPPFALIILFASVLAR